MKCGERAIALWNPGLSKKPEIDGLERREGHEKGLALGCSV